MKELDKEIKQQQEILKSSRAKMIELNKLKNDQESINDQARKKIDDLRKKKEIASITSKYQKHIGKCFKYENCFLEPPKSKWFLYSKILDIIKDEMFIEEFETVPISGYKIENTKLSIEILETHCMFGTEIPQKEYETARKNFFKRHFGTNEEIRNPPPDPKPSYPYGRK